MDKSSFNRDMEDYLSRRTSGSKPKLSDRIKDTFLKPKNKDNVKTSLEVYGDDMPRYASSKPDISRIEREYEELDHLEEEIEERKDSLLKRLLKAINPFSINYKEDTTLGYEPADDEEYEYVEEVTVDQEEFDQDVKEVLIIALDWIKKLPREDILQIKRTADYEKFKNILRKYGLLKE